MRVFDLKSMRVVSLVINGHFQRRWTDVRATRRGGCPWGEKGIRLGPTRTSRMHGVPTLRQSEEHPGAEYGTEKAQTKDGAGGGPAGERVWARGRGMGLLKIEEARTRGEYVTTDLN
jgi:hypothetical protein